MQLNAWEGRLARRLVDVLAREKPDIICLQEIFSTDGDIPRPYRQFSVLNILANRLGYSNIFMSPLSSFDVGPARVDYGNAIISRYPFINTKTVFVNGSFNPNLNGDNFDEYATNLQLAELSYETDKTMTIANHHGRINTNRMGDDQAVQSMEKIRREIGSFANQSQPIVLCGDLNIVSESPAIRVWEGIMTDTTSKFNIQTTLSPLSKVGETGFIGDSNVVCDHIMTNEHITINGLDVLDDLISDHHALVLDFSTVNKPMARQCRELSTANAS